MINLSSVEDLEGKSPQEIWSVICGLANYNASLLNTISLLNGTIRQKDADINILRGELSDIATLRSEYARLLQENEDLKKRIGALEKEFAVITEGLPAREIGNRADIAALKKVFPGASKKPYSIRSLTNLEQFIDDPSRAFSNSLCPPGAVEAWNAMCDIDKNEIKANLLALKDAHPGLIYSIKTLKSNYAYAHTINCITDINDYFRQLGDEIMVDAIQVCSQLLL
jgi:hypothetical protein